MQAASQSTGGGEMTFVEHLTELRTRLIRCAIAWLIATAIAYFASDVLFIWIMRPLIDAWRATGLGQPKIHFLNPVEPFFTYLKVGLFGGLFLASPVVFYQLWCFVAPGLYKREKAYALPFTVASALCFLGGACFGYYIVFPYGFRFFLGMARRQSGGMQALLQRAFGTKLEAGFTVTATLTMSEYFGLAWRLLLAFGLVFELPLLIIFLAAAGLVDHKMLLRFNRYFVVVAFVVSAILTPPDVITQLMMSGPLIVLYNISILFAFFFNRRRARQAL